MSQTQSNVLSPVIPPPVPGPGWQIVRRAAELKANPLQFFRSLAAEYGGLWQLRLPGQHFFVASDADAVHHVLVEGHRNYWKGASVEKARLLVGNGLATSDGDLWRRQRRLMQPAFHRQRLAQLTDAMVATADRVLDSWHGRTQPFDLTGDMMALTLQVIVKTMFSLDIGPQAQAITEAFSEGLRYINSISFSAFTPPLWLPTPRNRRFKRALHRLDETVFAIIQERRQQPGAHGDLLDMLLTAVDVEDNLGMDDRQLRDEVVTMFFAGHETTALTLTWAWYALTQHPQIEERLRAEVQEVLGGRPPTFADLPRLAFTQRVVAETLRLYPPAWVFIRSAKADDVVNGYRIPGGADVLLVPYLTHRDPRYWEQPERFDPDRFLPERARGRHKMAYYPFGAGQRMCIGRDFAQMEATLVLARMAQRFRLRPVTDRPVEAVPLVTLRPKEGFWVTISNQTGAS